MSDVTSILSQIRSYQHQMGTRAVEPNPGAFAPSRVGLEQPGVKAPSFGETLQNALEGVNGAQRTPARWRRPSNWAIRARTWRG